MWCFIHPIHTPINPRICLSVIHHFSFVSFLSFHVSACIAHLSFSVASKQAELFTFQHAIHSTTSSPSSTFNLAWSILIRLYAPLTLKSFCVLTSPHTIKVQISLPSGFLLLLSVSVKEHPDIFFHFNYAVVLALKKIMSAGKFQTLCSFTVCIWYIKKYRKLFYADTSMSNKNNCLDL